jgi:uncharacterized protein (DUF2147 family)
MKILLFAFALFSTVAWSKEIKNFSNDLLENVQKDIKNENDDQFRKKAVGRGPASVEIEPEGKHIEQEKKIDKNVRQTGNQNW